MEAVFQNLLSCKGHSSNILESPNAFHILLVISWSLQSLKSKGKKVTITSAHSSQSTVPGTWQILKMCAAALEGDVDPGP